MINNDYAGSISNLNKLCDQYAKNKDDKILENQVCQLWQEVLHEFRSEFRKDERKFPICLIESNEGNLFFINRIGLDDDKQEFFKQFTEPEIALTRYSWNVDDLGDVDDKTIQEFCNYESHQKDLNLDQWTRKQVIDLYRMGNVFEDRKLQELCIKAGHLQIEIPEDVNLKLSPEFKKRIDELNALYKEYLEVTERNAGTNFWNVSEKIFNIWEEIQKKFPDDCKKIDAKCPVALIKSKKESKKVFFVNRLGVFDTNNDFFAHYLSGKFKKDEIVLEKYNCANVDEDSIKTFCQYKSGLKNLEIDYFTTKRLVSLFKLADAFGDVDLKELCLKAGHFPLVETKKQSPHGFGLLFTSKAKQEEIPAEVGAYPVVGFKYEAKSDEQLIQLAKNYPSLEQLNLTMKGTAESLQKLSELQLPVSALDLSYSRELKFNDLKFLKDLNSLTSLKLTGCSNLEDLTDEGLKEIAPGLEKLNSLDLSSNKQMSSDEFIRISPHLTKLNSLNLGGTNIGLPGLLGMSKSIKDLDFLGLSSCEPLMFAGLKPILELQNKTVFLDLSWNSIVDSQLEKIGDGFLKLKGLDLSSCKYITAEGLVTVAQYLQNLTSLNLSLCTGMNDNNLSQIVRHVKKLEFLDISAANITEKGIKLISDELKELRSLNISQIRISEEDLDLLCTNLPHLTSLDITYSNISQYTIEETMKKHKNLKIIKTI